MSHVSSKSEHSVYEYPLCPITLLETEPCALYPSSYDHGVLFSVYVCAIKASDSFGTRSHCNVICMMHC